MVLEKQRRERHMPMRKDLTSYGSKAIYGFIVLCRPVNFITKTTHETFNP